MDNRDDPIFQFFPDADSIDLYEVLSVTHDATSDEIKKAYRRLALAHHPDKHTTASESAKADASVKFQQIGFAYTVLSDDKRRKRYDSTGKTDEGVNLAPGVDGWESYFEDLFDRVTKEKLDELKKEYQGSEEEVEDIKKAYLDCDGSIDDIMNRIPHSTFDDEARFVVLISELILKGSLPSSPHWEAGIKDEKAKLVRKKQSQKEAEEAEKLSKELGVWEEFYGDARPSPTKGRGGGKGKAKQQAEDQEEDHSALQALILKKRNLDGFFDSLAAKYAEPEPRSKKGRKRGKAADGDEAGEPPKKRKLVAVEPPVIDEEEFRRLQQKLFDNKTKSEEDADRASSKGRKATRDNTVRRAR
ncbi:uncharacterized protein FIBRA_01130 [Fibroporia radiculosa]|uniref:J domain-containing protein n=1 Tax=Fibroporia radiculosa TaxID=599839 RepID=J4I8B4_9APHY|nr:uncharacterized protein FIBRA_01130 [Fibroporia radiculosa]CCL99116.1 predicted protein [Fibroporia radiculosa]